MPEVLLDNFEYCYSAVCKSCVTEQKLFLIVISTAATNVWYSCFGKLQCKMFSLQTCVKFAEM
jgi:hypothetical protein